MTTGIILSTPLDQTGVYKAVKKVGFKEPTEIGNHHTHDTVDGLVLQMIGGNPFRIEFEDQKDQFPDNPQAIEVLRKLNSILPELMYRVYSFPLKSTPDGTVSDYLDALQ